MRFAGLFVIGVVMVGGCNGCAPALRGDGSLAVLEISGGVREIVIQWGDWNKQSGAWDWKTATMEDAYCIGAHYWDAVGAQVRCRREVEGEHAQSDVHVDRVDSWEVPGNVSARYLPGLSLIRQSREPHCSQLSACSAIAAHEIGHALGILGHLDDQRALMSVNGNPDELQPADVAAFREIWN